MHESDVRGGVAYSGWADDGHSLPGCHFDEFLSLIFRNSLSNDGYCLELHTHTQTQN